MQNCKTMHMHVKSLCKPESQYLVGWPLYMNVEILAWAIGPFLLTK